MSMEDTDKPVAAERRGGRVLGPPPLSGSSLGLLFWWQSLSEQTWRIVVAAIHAPDGSPGR
jgi:hypothetical protein